MRCPRKILVVEDDADSAGCLKKLLQLKGFEPRIAGGYAEARTIALVERFDLLLCDIGLPDGDGCELMKELAELYGIKGIALTGYGGPADIERCASAGFAAHLIKPLSFSGLEAAMGQVLSTTTADQAADPAADPFHFFG